MLGEQARALAAPHFTLDGALVIDDLGQALGDYEISLPTRRSGGSAVFGLTLTEALETLQTSLQRVERLAPFLPEDMLARLVNTDRNIGNILIDADWNIWMIDFTRAFRRTRTLLAAGDLKKCDRQLLEKLRGLTAEGVTAATRPYIGGAEIEPLMIRRDLIVALFDKLIAEKGDAQVLY